MYLIPKRGYSLRGIETSELTTLQNICKLKERVESFIQRSVFQFSGHPWLNNTCIWKCSALQEERKTLSQMTNFHFGILPARLRVFKRTKILVSVSRVKLPLRQ